MLSKLKSHPFAVKAFFKHSAVLTFAFPKDQLEPLIPSCLSLDTYNNNWAFVAVALVQTNKLRPAGFAEFMGNNFFLIGYRIFVTYTNKAGKRLRGLYIIKSETDSRLMQLLGNLFTHYHYTKIDIKQKQQGSQLHISSKSSGLSVQLKTDADNVTLPAGSPFGSWKDARRFAGPLPFTFTYLAEKNQVLIVEGVRESWVPQPVQVLNYHIPLLKSNHLTSGVLASAFIVNNIPYHWKKGVIEQCM